MGLSDGGWVIEREWKRLAERFPGLEVDEYQVMPNHLHGILVITQPLSGTPGRSMQRMPADSGRPRGTHAGSIGRVVQAFRTPSTFGYGFGAKHYGWLPHLGSCGSAATTTTSSVAMRNWSGFAPTFRAIRRVGLSIRRMQSAIRRSSLMPGPFSRTPDLRGFTRPRECERDGHARSPTSREGSRRTVAELSHCEQGRAMARCSRPGSTGPLGPIRAYGGSPAASRADATPGSTGECGCGGHWMIRAVVLDEYSGCPTMAVCC